MLLPRECVVATGKSSKTRKNVVELSRFQKERRSWKGSYRKFRCLIEQRCLIGSSCHVRDPLIAARLAEPGPGPGNCYEPHGRPNGGISPRRPVPVAVHVFSSLRHHPLYSANIGVMFKDSADCCAGMHTEAAVRGALRWECRFGLKVPWPVPD